MKQNIIMIVILIALFFFGLLIYDFSDELDPQVNNHDWYAVEDKLVTIVSFKDNKFSYYYEETGKAVSLYDLCTAFRFNRSINVIKLNCAIKGNKLYITSVDDEKLVITIDGTEKTFYATKKDATEAEFMKENEMSSEEFAELMNIDLNKFTITTTGDINELYKSKSVKLVALVNKSETITNALNLRALYNLSANSNKPLLVLIIDELSVSELTKLNKYNSAISKEITDFKTNTIPIYSVGNKKFNLTLDIEVKAFSEVNNYNNI